MADDNDKTRGLNLRNIPGLAAMLAVDRWCVWYWKIQTEKNGRRTKTKVPHIPGTPHMARVNDLKGVVGYDAARAAVLAENAAGVGWRMVGDLGRVALDLDKCVDAETGETDAWALAVLEAAEGAYKESDSLGDRLADHRVDRGRRGVFRLVGDRKPVAGAGGRGSDR